MNAAFDIRFAHLRELRHDILKQPNLDRDTREQLLREMDRHVTKARLGKTWLSEASIDYSEISRKDFYRQSLNKYVEIRDRNAPIWAQIEALARERTEAEARAEAEKTNAGFGGILLAVLAGVIASGLLSEIIPDPLAFVLFGIVTVIVLLAIGRVRRQRAVNRLEEPGEEALKNARTAIESIGDEDYQRYYALLIKLTHNPFPEIPTEPTRIITREVKAAVFARDGGVCQHCGSGFEIEYDHIMPYSLGGSNSAGNIQLLCSMCNKSKGNRYFY